MRSTRWPPGPLSRPLVSGHALRLGGLGQSRTLKVALPGTFAADLARGRAAVGCRRLKKPFKMCTWPHRLL